MSVADKMSQAYVLGADDQKRQQSQELEALEKDRDDWKAIAEMNSDIIDRLRAEIEEMGKSHV